MRIALAQMGSVPGAFEATVERMLEAARRAEQRGADLVVYPATVFSGAYPLGLVEQRAYQMDLLGAISDFARRTPVAAAVSAYISDETGGYTEVFLCDDGGACPLRRRETCVPGASFDSPADAPATCAVADVTLRFLAGDTVATAPESSCDIAVALSPLPFCHEDASTLGIHGIASGALAPLVEGGSGWFVLLQGVGAYDDVVLAGGSFATSPDGTVVAACPLFEEELAVFDAAPVAGMAQKAGEGEKAGADGKPGAGEKPGVSSLVGRHISDVPTLSEDERTGCLYRALVTSVRDYVRKSGFSDVVVGLSGGIDSSVVAAIAADALGAEHVLGVLMPGPYSSTSSVQDALELAGNLGVAAKTVPISAPFEAFEPLLSDALGAPFGGVARENLQARLRGTVLMSLANALGSLVLNTGNKSESGMGYSTLYGDTVGAYAPLADVYKGAVYRLAEWRNSRGPLPVIPQNVLVKPPSAELSEGQTDEASFGVSYAEVDRILTMHVERGLDAQDIVDAGIAPDAVARVLSACANAEYKRRQEPFGPMVSLRPFVDRAWPVVLGWRDRAEGSQGSYDGSGTCDAVVEPDGLCDCAACSGAAGLSATGLDAAGLIDGTEAAQAAASEKATVDDVLDAMLAQSVHQDQIVGMLGDVAFGAFVSGRGADMDDCLGLPLFSKN